MHLSIVTPQPRGNVSHTRLQSLEIARRRFRKFNSKYIESIKNARGRSSARGAENAVLGDIDLPPEAG